MLKKLFCFFTPTKPQGVELTREELVQHIAAYPEGLPRFFAVMSSLNPARGEKVQPCSVTQRRYRLHENYKVELKPLDEAFESRVLYIGDLLTLIRQGEIRLARP